MARTGGGSGGPLLRARLPEPGEFRAPLTPSDFDGPGNWRWLCLEHVREHNAKYNFFEGMSTGGD